MGFGGESYVVAAIATDILVGKKRPDIEYERLRCHQPEKTSYWKQGARSAMVERRNIARESLLTLPADCGNLFSSAEFEGVLPSPNSFAVLSAAWDKGVPPVRAGIEASAGISLAGASSLSSSNE